MGFGDGEGGGIGGGGVGIGLVSDSGDFGGIATFFGAFDDAKTVTLGVVGAVAV